MYSALAFLFGLTVFYALLAGMLLYHAFWKPVSTRKTGTVSVLERPVRFPGGS